MSRDEKSEQREEKDAVFTTIVGGRPPGSGTRVGQIPRGVEVLVKKASVDPEFRRLLLEKRGEAASQIDLELTDAERSMLSSIPAEQLEKIIDNIKVKPEHREVFLGTVGKLMLAVVIGGAFVSVMTPTLGHTVSPGERERILRERAERTKAVEDANEPNETEVRSEENPRIFSAGVRIDRPPQTEHTWLQLPSEEGRNESRTRQYVVQEVENLWLIAARQLGDGSRYEEIVKLNPGLPQDGRDLTPGMQLIIPAE